MPPSFELAVTVRHILQLFSMDNSEDDLARAIFLSLQESNSFNKPSDSVDDDAQFQEELKQAIEASCSTTLETPPLQRDNNSFLSERAQLEKERLERQRKLRKAQNLPPSDEESHIESDSDEDAEGPIAKRQRRSLPNPSTNHQTTASSTSTPGAKLKGGPFFWDGEWRPTATRGVEPRKDKKPTFRLSEILGDELCFAIISTFSEQNSWIYSFFPSVPVILVASPGEDGRAGVKNIFPKWIRTAPTLPNGMGCMHMKFMLLFYKTGRLRVVVSTANLIEYDWRDIENAVWLQDILPLSRKTTFDERHNESFQYVMKRVLDGVNVKTALNIMLKQGHPDLPIQSTQELCTSFDWSRVKAHLVPSFAGKGWPKVLQNGHPRLMKAVRNMGLRTGKGPNAKKVQLEYQGSSLGQYTTQWMNEFYHSVRGESAEDWLDTPKARRAKLPYPTDVKVVFPSFLTVRGSQYGEAGGSNIFCTRKQWEVKNFPRALFFDSNSKAGKTLMHTKMMVCTVSSNVKPPTFGERGQKDNIINVDTDSDDSDSDNTAEDEIEVVESHVGWAYLGSHNFTPSAWGYLSGSAFNPVLNTRNYELGVVFPLKDMSEANETACFERPPRHYGPNDLPWIREESIYAVQWGLKAPTHPL
ncbi:hypothetical protein D9757_012107 [Collybiopsis confluens]|uniref:Phospholipase D/nuclease n=1 Tax=Collybiopsis confluens TaxID=2823264 RepID=A0A8H5D3A9_9AGAR|nr:hypothetical protein D9757_012107 [Collybiopsis confluens]